ncbi:MAG: ribosomal L7Ae/L30e/S12e/Gadd45 family protein [Bacillota bacterium]|nr:ribosomal L7Ae/L30e/S12e/Gadd45 family protein [Bacillota bacterium]
MDLEKVKGYVGIASRQGKAVGGEYACRTALLKGEADLLIFSSMMSEGTRRRLEAICDTAGTPRIILPPEADPGDWAGKPGRLCVAIIKNEGLAGEIMRFFNDARACKGEVG